MNTVKIISPSEAVALMSDPELFDRISDDNCQSPELNIEFGERDVIYGCFRDGVLCGVVSYNPESSVTVEVHCNFVKSKRDYALELVKMTVVDLFKTYKSISKVNACVPVCYPDVIGFCFKFGLITEGIDRKSILKGGKLLDRMRLGATRNEIERFL